MLKKGFMSFIVLVIALLAVSCTQPPEEERKLAEKAFRDAALAKDCDKENYVAAEELLNKAREAYAKEKNDEAKELFIKVKEKADAMLEYYRTHPDECMPKKEVVVQKKEKVVEMDKDDPANPDMEFPLIHFEYNKYEIRDEDEAYIKRIYNWMTNFEEAVIRAEGHADERGSIDYNMALGEKRAQAVKKALVMLGIDANRIKIISYGEERPVSDGHDEDSWYQNRRVEIVKTNF